MEKQHRSAYENILKWLKIKFVNRDDNLCTSNCSQA